MALRQSHCLIYNDVGFDSGDIGIFSKNASYAMRDYFLIFIFHKLKELKRSPKDRHTQTHGNCTEIFRQTRLSFSIGRE